MTDTRKQPPARSSYTLRLTFAYSGNEVRLIRSERVAMITPPAHTQPPQEGQTGYWFEVHGAKGDLLYHRALHSPIRTDIEVFSDDPEQTISRVPNPKPEGEFTLLVPDLPNAHSLVIHGPRADDESRAAYSQRLLSYPFEELRRAQTTHQGHAAEQNDEEVQS
jgi:hypothetical protein